MKLILVAYKYLKKHPILAGIVLFSITAASFFEGASFGMLIPLMQSMTSRTANLLEKIPFVNHLLFSLDSINQTKLISFIFIFIFISLLIKNIFVYLSSILIAKLRFSIIRDLRTDLMNNLLEYDIKYFDGMKTGHIIGNVTTETQRMGDFIKAMLQVVVFSGRVLVYMLLLFLISWKVSIVIFLLIVTVLIPIELIVKKLKKIGMHISKAIADYNHKLTEILNGLRLIREYGTEEQEKRDFKTTAKDIYRFEYKNNKYMQLIIPLSEVLIFGLIVLCFLVLVNKSNLNVTNAFPFIATYLLVLARMLTQLNSLNNNRSVAMSRLAAFTNYEGIYNERGKKTIKSGDKKISKFHNSIEFKNVNFSYVAGKKILKDINIKIPKGKITAFVGASGAGKSTIVNLIPRFYDVNSGEIMIDGLNLKRLSIKEWRKTIGFVSQDIFIFNTSVKNNISYGCANVNEKEIIESAKVANAHEFIINLPDGYDAVLGERGVKLSGGQKQRISIARAITHNPEILILDEATSSLDTKTERLITEAINRLTKDRTVIAIAHRLSTILHADNIVVLDEGKVVEQGRHVDLLRKDGLYTRLCETQFDKDKTMPVVI